MNELQHTAVILPANYQRKDLTLMDIYNAVARHTGVVDFTVKSRKRKFTYPRSLYFYLSRKLTPEGWKGISSLLGERDHTTAIHGSKTLHDLFDTEEKVRKDVQDIKQMLLN